MTRMAETSIEAFQSFDPDVLQQKERLVLSAFSGDRALKLTRNNICSATGLPINSVCGRVRSLLDKGWLEVDGDTIAPGTNKRHELLKLA